MKNRIIFGLLYGYVIYTISCNFTKEFLDMKAPTIESYSPEASFLNSEEVTEVQVSFSKPMDRRSTEDAFTFKRDHEALGGTFQWKTDKTFSFTPYTPVEKNRTYSFSLSTQAEDPWGNSLAKEFSHTFHTKQEKDSPRVLRLSPEKGGVITDRWQSIQVVFSESMDIPSSYQSFSLFPSLKGSFSWKQDNTILCWTPLEPYQAGETYKLRISQSATDTSGNSLREEYVSTFEVSRDPAPEATLKACSSNKTLLPVADGSYLSPNGGIEKDELFCLEFSCPVEGANRSTLLSFSPVIRYQVNWNDTGDKAFVTLLEPLKWKEVYELRVLNTLYRMKVSGLHSFPPQVLQITYLPDLTQSAIAYTPLHFAHNYSFSSSPTVAFDVHFLISEGSSIPLGEFVSSFSINVGNSCLDVELVRIEPDPVSPPPLPLPIPSQEIDGVFLPVQVQVIRVH
ncbi:MAG: Ig-like domain-containing protein, partial [Spirochaetales bacterium]